MFDKSLRLLRNNKRTERRERDMVTTKILTDTIDVGNTDTSVSAFCLIRAEEGKQLHVEVDIELVRMSVNPTTGSLDVFRFPIIKKTFAIWGWIQDGENVFAEAKMHAKWMFVQMSLIANEWSNKKASTYFNDAFHIEMDEGEEDDTSEESEEYSDGWGQAYQQVSTDDTEEKKDRVCGCGGNGSCGCGKSDDESDGEEASDNEGDTDAVSLAIDGCDCGACTIVREREERVTSVMNALSEMSQYGQKYKNDFPVLTNKYKSETDVSWMYKNEEKCDCVWCVNEQLRLNGRDE